MKRFILVPFLMALFLLAACSPTQKDSVSNTNVPYQPQTDGQGAVTVNITPLNLDQPDDSLKFDVSLETHSVELDMDLATLATLTTDTGISVTSTLWDAPRGGHHVEGVLSFPSQKDGKPVLDGAKQITITITGVDNATRAFTWDLNIK